MKLVVSNAAVSWGGGEVVAEKVALGLQRRGHEVVLFCHSRGVLYERLRERMECEPVLSRTDFDPRAILRADRALRLHRPQLVFASIEKDLRLTGLAARRLGVPVVACRTLNRPLGNGLRHRLLYGRVAAHCVVNSRATRRTVLESAPWLAPSRVSVIPHGIAVDHFAAATAAPLPVPFDAVVVGFVGRLSEEKGLPELAEAWLRIAAVAAGAHLVIAGRGALEGRLRARLEGAPRVHWRGFARDVSALMKAFDLLVVPSYEEGFGLVAAEAMAAAVPVVATRVGGLVEVVEDGVTGRLVPPRDSRALAAALLALLRDPELRRRMGRAGEERVRLHFSEEVMLDRYEALLGAVAAGAPLPAPAADGATLTS